jgi:hypothetical protein
LTMILPARIFGVSWLYSSRKNASLSKGRRTRRPIQAPIWKAPLRHARGRARASRQLCRGSIAACERVPGHVWCLPGRLHREMEITVAVIHRRPNDTFAHFRRDDCGIARPTDIGAAGLPVVPSRPRGARTRQTATISECWSRWFEPMVDPGFD